MERCHEDQRHSPVEQLHPLTQPAVFVGDEKAIALISSILATAVIATGLVATAVAGFKQGEAVLNRAGEGVVVVERQITRGGSLMGYTEAW